MRVVAKGGTMRQRPRWTNRVAIGVLVLTVNGCREVADPRPGLCAEPAPVTGSLDPAAPGFIVGYREGVGVVSETDRLASKYGFTPSFVYTVAFRGFAAILTPDTVASLRCEASILSIEHNAVVRAN